MSSFFDSTDSAGLRKALLSTEAHAIGTPVPPSEPLRLPPKNLGGFEVLEEIGRGSFGVVYKARDPLDGREVAIKVLRPTQGQALLRFHREFRHLDDLFHENLVFSEVLLEEDGRCFFTMEWVDGEDVLTYIHRAPSEEERWRRLRQSLRQILSGVSFLHDRGVVHCDLKPKNILVRKQDGQVVILDLGLAIASREDQAEALGGGGTPDYMSPEQARGDALSPKVDLFAIGILLFEALMGTLPHRHGPSWRSERSAYVPVDPRTLRGDLPSDLSALCFQMQDPAATARPSAAEALLILGAKAPLDSDAFVRPKGCSGRQDTLAALWSAFDECRTGKLVQVVLTGPSGIGKSTLVRHFLKEVRAQKSALVLSGRCHERVELSYKAIVALIDSLSEYLLEREKQGDLPACLALPLPEAMALGMLFPVLGEILTRQSPREGGFSIGEEQEDRQALRSRAFAALRSILRGLADKEPLILTIDDLDYGDRDSMALLSALFAREAPSSLSFSRLLFLSTQKEREDGVPIRVDDLYADVRHKIPLLPLSQEQGAELARELLANTGKPDPTLAEAIAKEAGGSPYFIAELVRSGQSHADLGLSVEDMIRVRIEALPAPEQELLSYVALTSRPCSYSLLQEATGLSKVDAGKARLRLCRAQLCRMQHVQLGPKEDTLVDVGHDRVRQALLRSSISSSKRMQIHKRLADVLLSKQAEPEDLLFHLRGAGELSKARHVAVQAAQKAALALAFERAAEFYEEALNLGLSQDDIQADELNDLRCQLGDALSEAGQVKAAADVYLQAATLLPPAKAFSAKRKAAEQLLRGGYMQRGEDILREVLSEVSVHMPSSRGGTLTSLLYHRAVSRIYSPSKRKTVPINASVNQRIEACWSAGVGLSMVDPLRSADFHARHLSYALRAGDKEGIAQGYLAEASLLFSEGGGAKKRALHLVAQAIELGVTDPEVVETVMGAIAAHSEGRFADAVPHWQWVFKQGRSLAKTKLSELHYLQIAEVPYLVSLQMTRSFAEVRQVWRSSLERAKERGNLFAETSIDAAITPYICLSSGKLEEGFLASAQALSRFGGRTWNLQHLYTMLTQADLLLAQGRFEQAYGRLVQDEKACERSLLLRAALLRVYGQYLRGRAALSLHRLGEARRHSRDLLGEKDVCGAEAMGHALQAGVYQRNKQKGEAVAAYERAAAQFAQAKMVYHERSVRAALASLLGRKADVEAELSQLATLQLTNPEALVQMLCP